MFPDKNLVQPLRGMCFAALAMLLIALPAFAQESTPAEASHVINYSWPSTYTNPLSLYDPKTGPVVSCPDPAIIRQRKDWFDVWYLYCTGDPLNSNDKDSTGNLKNHLIPIYRSYDLIHWTYLGDAFQTAPTWAAGNTQFWAPAIKHFNHQYYLYYVAPNGPGAIGVATSKSPAGPWIDSGAPVVAPEPNPYNHSFDRKTIDPDVVKDNSGQRYIAYGTFNGGISIRKLAANGLTSDPSSETQIGIDNHFEGASFNKHDGWYYLFVSSTNCCNGPLSGYTVFVGRARTPLGPFLDKNGISLAAFNAGGEVSAAANGNKWVGPGGNVIFTDDSGQAYMLYHAVDQTSPYFSGYPGFTRRPALLDPVDWIDGWPTVRGGYWVSSNQQPAPAAQPWLVNLYRPRFKDYDYPGKEIKTLSDEFNTTTLSPQWHFIHPQANNSYLLTDGAYQVQTLGFDENSDPTQVSILGEPVPDGDYMVETKVTTGVPFNSSCCDNFAQPALFIYGNDQNSIKLDVFPDYDARQTEFGKQIDPVPMNYPTYGNMVVGSPGQTTWLRIAKRKHNGKERYTAYTSDDGERWTRGGTWDHQLGNGAQIGIAAENRVGFTMDFDYVRVYQLQKGDGTQW